jgi:tetratricopeptide (TPR) repeat protein
VRKLVLFALLVASAACLWAQAVEVLYAEGLEVQRGTGWAAVEAGATIAPDAVVRLSAGGTADLGRGGSVITLTRAGAYKVNDLVRSATAATSWGMGSVVGSKLSALTSGTRGTNVQAPVAGVRGADQTKSSQLAWIEDESADAAGRGLGLLSKGQPADALRAFLEAAERAGDQEAKSVALFYCAYASDVLGQKAQAVRFLARVAPNPGVDYYRDFVLLKSRLLIEGAAAPDALTLLDGYLATNPAGPDAQDALLLAAFAYRSLGDNRAAVARLNRARDLGPTTDPGKRAAVLAAELQ